LVVFFFFDFDIFSLINQSSKHHITTTWYAHAPQIALFQSVVKPATTTDAAADNDDDKTEIVYVRIMERQRINPAAMVKEHILNPIARLLPDTNKNSKQEGTVNFFTGARRRNLDEDSDDDVDDADSIMESFKDDQAAVDDAEGEEDGWHPKYKIPLRMFNVVESSKKHKNVVVVSFKFKNRSTQREFIFDSDDQADEFRHIINVNQNLIKARAKARLERALNGIQLQKDEQLTFLVDICSGSDIPQADVGRQSDPYVTVTFEGRLIHKTAYISNDAKPIWTLRKGSLFIWKVDALELFESHPGLVFEVKDYDAVGEDESLGAFTVNARTLYKWPQNERKVFALKSLPGEKDWKQGRIALRVRRATEYDIEFMEKYNSKQKTMPSPPKMAEIKDVLTKNSRKQKDGTREYRVRPGPDPNRVEATTWLTKDKLDEESLKESYEWLDIGSGNLGKIFVEVIKCDNLPNMDSGGTFGNKTDAFASLVYEDCVVSTDIISNCLSPRWMPWGQRAFIFNMMHTSSQLFVAIFDSDRNVALNNHDLCGRVSIDLSNFRPDTVYLLDYNLFPTAKSGPRDAKYGTITIRLRLELADEKVLVLSNMKPPQSVYVNVHTKRDFHVLRQTVEGNRDTKVYSLFTIKSHCDELYSYLTIYYAMEDAIIRLFLWRGGKEVFIPTPDIAAKSIKWIGVRFPITSVIAFLSFINLIEKPDLIPSFFFASIGWLLVLTAGWRLEHPSPWMWCKNFQYFLFAVVFGRVPGPQTIDPNQWADDKAKGIHSYDYWEARVRQAEEKAKQRAEEYRKEQEEYLRELEEIGDVTEELVEYSTGFGIDPIRTYLFPIQQYLGVLTNGARVVKNILTWEESYISFLISMICFILSFAVFFVPWAWCIKWSLRIIIWVAFGPWMKLVDIFYFSKPENSDSEKERKNKLKLEREKKIKQHKQETQLKREKASKLRDFKQYMFGERICRVNILKKDRYYDLPLDSSRATPYSTMRKSLGTLAIEEAGYGVTRIEGQQLEGELIPKVSD
jgi:hypothetical protein